MQKSLLLLVLTSFLLVCNLPTGKGQQFPTLSSSAEISLLTCSPGFELYNCFGHTGVRVVDSLNNIDWVYNYGTFDFDTPNFYEKFVRGKLLYLLSKSSFKSFLRVYVIEHRGVSEQRLLIDSVQKQAVFNYLETNYLPENKSYLYDFFYDNCATRPRDVLIASLGKDLVFPDEVPQKRFRTLLDEYIIGTPWIDFGIDLILGIEADKKASFSNQMFLPDYLSTNLGKAKLNGKPLFAEPNWILANPDRVSYKFYFSDPIVFTLGIFLMILICSFFFQKKKRLLVIMDQSFFLILALIGLFFTFMWFGTDHIATKWNMNILWLNPIYLLWFFVRIFKGASKFASYLVLFFILCNALALLVHIFGIQHFHIAAFPLIFASLLRLGLLARTAFLIQK